MYHVGGFFRGNDRLWRNKEMIAKHEFIRFTVSAILHTVQDVVRYHSETDPRLTHLKYGVIGPICGPVLQFFRYYNQGTSSRSQTTNSFRSTWFFATSRKLTRMSSYGTRCGALHIVLRMRNQVFASRVGVPKVGADLHKQGSHRAHLVVVAHEDFATPYGAGVYLHTIPNVEQLVRGALCHRYLDTS